MKNIIHVILFLSFFSPMISLVIYNLVGSSVALLPQLTRDILIVIISICLILLKLFEPRNDLGKRLFVLFLFLCFLISFSFIISLFNDDIMNMVELKQHVITFLNNIRRFGFMLLVLLLFSFIKHSDYNKTIYIYLYVFWIFGLVEYFSPESFWLSVKLPYYWRDVVDAGIGSGDGILNLKTNGRMYTYDTVHIIGERSRRLISLYLEPTTTASLAIASLYISYLNRKKILFILSVICGLLTFSKGFILAFIALLGFWVVSSMTNSKRIELMYVKFVGITIVAALAFFYYLFNFDPIIFRFGFLAHLYGLYAYFNNFELFGYGIGVVGSFALIDNPLKIGIESALANLLSQTGIFGLIYMVFLFFILWNASLRNEIKLLTVFYFFLYATSNSASAYSGNFLMFYIFTLSLGYLNINNKGMYNP